MDLNLRSKFRPTTALCSSRVRCVRYKFQSSSESNFVTYLQLVEERLVLREADGRIIRIHRLLGVVTNRDRVGRMLQGKRSRIEKCRRIPTLLRLQRGEREFLYSIQPFECSRMMKVEHL